MNVYRIDYTTQAGNENYVHVTSANKSLARDVFLFDYINRRMFAVDLDKPVTVTLVHPLIPVN